MSPPSREEVLKSRRSNFRVAIVSSVIWSLVLSMSRWSIFDAYISVLAKTFGYKYSNSLVGLAESVNGLTTLSFALPVGWLVDRYRRTTLLRQSAIIGALASLVTIYGIIYDNITAILLSLFFAGVFTQFNFSITNALFADSVPAGQRGPSFILKGAAELSGLGVGPLILWGVFLLKGQYAWNLHMLHLPLLMGQCLVPLGLFMLFLWREPYPNIVDSDVEDPSVGVVAGTEAHVASLTKREKWIPYLVAASDGVRKIGAGMTIRFFGLFFMNDYNFTPENLALLYAVYPACIIAFQFVLRSMAGYIGRAQSAFVFQVFGITSLFGMYYLKNLNLLIAFFLIRGAFQNATYPIDRSIINDYVPSKHRGFWNGLESITAATWSGSAVLGGLISDVHDYRTCFLLTASIYFAAAILYTPLLFLVPRVEGGSPPPRKPLETPLLSGTPSKESPK